MSRPRLYVVGDSQAPPGASAPGALGDEAATGSTRTIDAGVDRQKISATTIPSGWQLPLPFDTEPLGPRIIIVSMETMNGPALRRLIQDLRPNAAVDLRELIRFDLPGMSRHDVLRTLHANHAHYVKDPLPWHRLDARAFATLEGPISNTLIHEIVERHADCVMILVHRSDDSRAIASHLHKVLSQRMSSPWHVEEAS